MPSLQVLSQIPLFSSLFNPLQQNIGTGQSCRHPLVSCPFPPPRDVDTCCLNHPSGHFLQTQFWDTNPALGSNETWTIHGLWPDLCNGGFDQFCDSSRNHNDIRGLLSSMIDEHPETRELLEFMDQNWLSINGDNPHLWAHEWNKHGTCISTLEPACYPSSPSNAQEEYFDVLDYFVQATSLYRTLDTYKTLAEAGIVPSRTARYSLSDLQDAVESSPHGFPVTFRCRGGELDEIWYHFDVRGPLRQPHPRQSDSASLRDPAQPESPFLDVEAVRDIFIPTNPDGIKSNCPPHGIRYLPKHGQEGPVPTSTSGSPSEPTSTSPPFNGRGHLEVHVVAPDGTSTHKGCLIRHGEWYTSGTCATYRGQQDVVDPGKTPLFSLSSSFAPCYIHPSTSKFECSKAAPIQGIFSADANVLMYKNSSKFYADKVPGRFEKVDVFGTDGGGAGKDKVEVEVRWVGV